MGRLDTGAYQTEPFLQTGPQQARSETTSSSCILRVESAPNPDENTFQDNPQPGTYTYSHMQHSSGAAES